ncbi:MAG: cyclic nucleotide-binding domain-containing protein [Desulfobacterales bacterium]|nr:cyclic nucleotide-binding domain-containing protein [Desulfobacterales bacterium]
MSTQFTPFTEYIKNKPDPEPVSKMEGFQIQHYGKGETIFSKGARGYAAYVIKSGEVEISIGRGGKKSVLTVLGEQAVFGEVALLTGNHTRSATATALEESQIIRIPKEVFEQYLNKSPRVISACLVAIAHRLNEFSTHECGRPATLERIARILDLLRVHGSTELTYGPTLSAVAKALVKPEDEIAQDLTTMEDFNLVESGQDSDGQQIITLLGGSRFLEKALKVFAMIERVEPV